MEKTNYKWLARLVNRITKEGQPNNDSFSYYGHEVSLSSGTRDYVAVWIPDWRLDFSFDFWTKELIFTSYGEYEERDTIIRAFRAIYNDRWQTVKVFDEQLDEDKRHAELVLADEKLDDEDRGYYESELAEILEHEP